MNFPSHFFPFSLSQSFPFSYFFLFFPRFPFPLFSFQAYKWAEPFSFIFTLFWFSFFNFFPYINKAPRTKGEARLPREGGASGNGGAGCARSANIWLVGFLQRLHFSNASDGLYFGRTTVVDDCCDRWSTGGAGWRYWSRR